MASATVPLYRKVLEDLRAKIEDGTYPLGSRLPSEVELIESYGVSRITVRRAVTELVNEGLLIKEQGRGTFVRSRWLKRSLRSSVTESFTDACGRMGLTAGAKVIDVSIVPAPAHYAEMLGIGPEELLIHVRRVRAADGWPVFEEDTYLPYGAYKEILKEDLTDASIFDVVERVGGMRPLHAVGSFIDAVPATRDQAEDLGVAVGAPLLKVGSCYAGADGKPISVARSFFVGGRMTLLL